MQQNGFPERLLGQGAKKIASAQKKPGENRTAERRANAARVTGLLSLLIVCYGNILRAASTGEALGKASGEMLGPVMDLVMGSWRALGDIGLFYLAMSFACHTALRYETPRSMKRYWSQTTGRTVAWAACLNALLLIWFFLQGKDGIFTARTLADILGLNGFSIWFRIRDTGPFGAEQWFITLLLLFYLAYPFINRHCRQPAATFFALIAAGHAAMVGQFFFPYDHALWSTAFGFMAGLYLCRNKPPLRKPLVTAGVSVLIMGAFTLMGGGTSVTTYAIIAMLGLILGLLTLPKSAPSRAGGALSPPGGIFLPLFLLHTHFFTYTFVAQPHLNAVIILACNAALAMIVSLAYARFEKIPFAKTTPPAARG